MPATGNEAPPLRIVFAGTPDFAAFQLAALANSRHKPLAVYTQPDRPAGRGKKVLPGPVKSLAQKLELPVFQPPSLKDPASQAELAALKPDLMIVVAYGLLLPKPVLQIPRLGCINIHASLLPRWRGAAPIQRAIEAGDSETGITLMQMDEGLDTGDMLERIPCPISPDETAASLHDKLARLAAEPLCKLLDTLASGPLQGEVQDDSQSCYAAKISKDEARIDWTLDTATLERRIRAFNPFPVCFTELGALGRIRIWQAAIESAETAKTGQAGTILRSDSEGILVACGQGCLRIEQLQLPGKRAVAARDVLNSHASAFAPGQQFS